MTTAQEFLLLAVLLAFGLWLPKAVHASDLKMAEHNGFFQHAVYHTVAQPARTWEA